MHHLLAGTPFRLTYLQGRRTMAQVDWVAIHNDLTDADTQVDYWRWGDLYSLTHVVLALDRDTGRHAGLLGLTARCTSSETWLQIETSLVRPQDEAGLLPRAMLAHALTRTVCFDGKPVAIAALRGGQTALPDLGAALRSVALHPPAEGNVIALEAARIARRIGGERLVLDLRQASEGSLLRDLRNLHGVRRDRRKAGSTATPATSDGATRRPRKATHIDRTG
jgi:hypothetical protein